MCRWYAMLCCLHVVHTFPDACSMVLCIPQAVEGPCTSARPAFWDMKARSKW